VGQYVVEGPQVLFTELSANGDCDPDLSGQDAHVLQVLGDGFRAEIDGDSLSLWSMGDVGLVYRSSSS
jgi:hypothetical protein